MKVTNPILSSALALSLALPAIAAAAAPAQAPPSAAQSAKSPVGTPLSASELSTLIPATVFFRGQTAPVQMRNAGAVRFAPDAVFFAALVDTSGYSSGVQQTYQFYLVTDAPVLIGGKSLSPGAYGGGFLADGTCTLMDLGGHPVLSVPVQNDAALGRPRPLFLSVSTPGSVRLYLGRRFVEVKSGK